MPHTIQGRDIKVLCNNIHKSLTKYIYLCPGLDYSKLLHGECTLTVELQGGALTNFEFI